MDDQEVAREVLLLDHRQLTLQAFLSDLATVRYLSSAPCRASSRNQLIGVGLARRNLEFGQPRFGQPE